MTEDEAKTRVCPFRFPEKRFVLADAPFPPHFDLGGLCIGSPCMLWRWSARPPLGNCSLAKEG